MKTQYAMLGGILMLGLALMPTAARAERYSLDSTYAELTIDVTRRPIFPLTLQQQGYTEGRVVVAFEVDHTGELRDWIVISGTHPDFVKSVANVIESWDFSPPKINGEPRSIVSRLTIDYHSTGNVLSFDLTTGFHTIRFNELTGWEAERVGLAKIKDLDTPPQPKVRVAPSVPQDVMRRYKGTSAVFTFYVDESGDVRIPSLQSIDGDAEPGMLLAAQEALERWKFDPPTVRSRPVSVKLSQTFVFNGN